MTRILNADRKPAADQQRVFLRSTLVAALLFFLPAACGNNEGPVSEKIEVRLALASQPSSGLIFVALEKGFFEQAGLNIKLIEYPSGKRALNEGLLSGRTDIAVCADVPLVDAALKGSRFKIFSTVFYADNVNRIIARRDAGISRPEDLINKRVATQYASAVHFFLSQFMLAKNIEAQAFQTLYMKAEELPKALAEGRIDAFSMREPYISRARELLGNNHIIFSAPGVYRQFEALVASDRLVRQQPKVLNRYLEAVLRAEEFVRREPQQAHAIIARKLGVDAAAVAAIWPETGLLVSLDKSSILLLEQIARWAVDSGMTENDSIPNFLNFVYQDALLNQKSPAVDITR